MKRFFICFMFAIVFVLIGVPETAVSLEMYWKIYNPMPQLTYYHACAYTDITGTDVVYTVGGNGASNKIYEFDFTTDTWLTSSMTLNYGVQKNAATVVKGKIYCIGGQDENLNAVNYNQEFDPATGTITDRAAMPTARFNFGALTWNDSLILCIGGETPSYCYNIVEIYNPVADSWQTATPLPMSICSFACGLTGDIIYISGGYNGSYIQNFWIGIIDTLNATSIMWTFSPLPPTLYRRGHVGTCCENKFFFTGGYGTSGGPLPDTWYYDPSDGWHQLPDKPTPVSSSQCAVYVAPLDGGIFFCAGGSFNSKITEGLVDLWSGIINADSGRDSPDFGFSKCPNLTGNQIDVTYTNPINGKVSLNAYDYMGRLIRILVSSVEKPGKKSVIWNTENLKNGIYFLRLEIKGKVDKHKLILIR